MTTYADRRTKLLEYHQKRYEDNPEHFKAISRAYYANHTELHRERVKESRTKKNDIETKKKRELLAINKNCVNL